MDVRRTGTKLEGLEGQGQGGDGETFKSLRIENLIGSFYIIFVGGLVGCLGFGGEILIDWLLGVLRKYWTRPVISAIQCVKARILFGFCELGCLKGKLSRFLDCHFDFS